MSDFETDIFILNKEFQKYSSIPGTFEILRHWYRILNIFGKEIIFVRVSTNWSNSKKDVYDLFDFLVDNKIPFVVLDYPRDKYNEDYYKIMNEGTEEEKEKAINKRKKNKEVDEYQYLKDKLKKLEEEEKKLKEGLAYAENKYSEIVSDKKYWLNSTQQNIIQTKKRLEEKEK